MSTPRLPTEFTGVSLGSRYWSTCNVEPHGELRHAPAFLSGYSPPSLLVPRYAGEPLRFDAWFPTHPRGSGRSSPAEAHISSIVGAGRFPLAAVWSGRRITGEKWRWNSLPDTPVQVEPVDAVAAAFRAVVARYGRRKTTVVIPNDFHQSEQQRVLDEINQVHPDTQLLWLPVAAALAWLEGFDKAEWAGRLTSGTLGDLVVLHCDWGHLQCSRLELHSIDRQSAVPIVPARRRPVVADSTVCGFGWTLIESGGRLASHWEKVFASDVSQPVESLFGAGVAAYQSSSHSNWLRELSGWSISQQPVAKALQELIEYLESLSASLFGVLIIGDFAQLIAKALNRYTESGRLNIQQPVAVYSGVDGERLLAHGAAVHCARQSAREVSYLDSLPEIELFVDRKGSFEWISLLKDSEQFVKGGFPWERPEPITGFELRRGSSQVKLVLAHEEYEGVRELVSSFEESHEQRTPVTLHVSCTPAQGNAKLRLVTAPLEGRKSHEVLANWQRMIVKTDSQSKPINKEDYLKSQPRSYPELMPRLASENKWRYAAKELSELLDRLRKTSSEKVLTDKWFLEALKNRLMQKDQSLAPRDATAIGSDFRCPIASQQRLLEASSKALLSLWTSYRNETESNVSTVIRCLGYLSVDNAEFEKWLLQSRKSHYNYAKAVEHTCGLTLRNPKLIAEFIGKIFSSDNASPNRDQLKAVSQILRYRTDATAALDSSKATQIVETCLHHFKQGVARGGRSFEFRWSSLIIVYMLRRRMFDSDFLDPSGELAVKAKNLFDDAIRKCRSGKLRPISGTVNLPVALEQMIAYIDRKGSGDILMAAEDA